MPCGAADPCIKYMFQAQARKGPWAVFWHDILFTRPLFDSGQAWLIFTRRSTRRGVPRECCRSFDGLAEHPADGQGASRQSDRILLMRWLVLASLCLALAPVGMVADHPSAPFANELIEAKVYLPDPEEGYYRGTRFDWSGAIYSLKFAGHQYFEEWQDSDDPYLHDRITGPVEEYRTEEKGLGYDDGADRFLRIGVGVVERPEEDDYRWRHTYEIVDPGEWSIRRGSNWIEFTHDVDEPTLGYGYRLVKRLTLTPGEPELVIDHVLENTGRRPIETNVYNHNFFVIDNQPTGPDFTVRFPFELKADREMDGYAVVDGRHLRYERQLPPGESIYALLTGFGDGPADHAFEIENRKVKAGVRVSTDRPLSKLGFWSPRTTLCPEPFIDLKISPGQADRWSIRYEFYTVD